MDFHEISIGISNNVQRVFIGFTWDVRGILIGFPLLCACDVRTHDGQVHISTILRQIPFLTIARVGKSEKIMLKREREGSMWQIRTFAFQPPLESWQCSTVFHDTLISKKKYDLAIVQGGAPQL